MLMKICSILLLTVALFVDSACSRIESDSYVEIWNISYTTMVPAGLGIGSVIRHSAASYCRFADDDLIVAVENAVRGFQGDAGRGVDARIVVLLYRNRKTDTLALGGYHMYLNNLRADVDLELLRMIGEYLGREDQDAIEWWIQEWNP